jgi:REP-associated tyrosine transposase
LLRPAGRASVCHAVVRALHGAGEAALPMPRPVERRRHPLRLRGFDYAQPGLYFVTICTHNRVCLFGEIDGGQMRLSEAGRTVARAWQQLPVRFPSVSTDAFVVMPNHVHAIVVLRAPGSGPPTGAASSAPTTNAPSLGKVLRAFKSLSAIEVNQRLNRRHQPLWQRYYYEHVIRQGKDLDEIRAYIAENPLRWDQDPENRR